MRDFFFLCSCLKLLTVVLSVSFSLPPIYLSTISASRMASCCGSSAPKLGRLLVPGRWLFVQMSTTISRGVVYSGVVVSQASDRHVATIASSSMMRFSFLRSLQHKQSRSSFGSPFFRLLYHHHHHIIMFILLLLLSSNLIK